MLKLNHPGSLPPCAGSSACKDPAGILAKTKQHRLTQAPEEGRKFMLMKSLRLEKIPKITNIPSWEGQPQNWGTSRVVLGVLFPLPRAGAIPLSQ